MEGVGDAGLDTRERDAGLLLLMEFEKAVARTVLEGERRRRGLECWRDMVARPTGLRGRLGGDELSSDSGVSQRLPRRDIVTLLNRWVGVGKGSGSLNNELGAAELQRQRYCKRGVGRPKVCA